MRILILGGTRFFGAEIVAQLLEAGHHVTVFSRGNIRPAWWADVEHVTGDRTHKESLTSALQGLMFDVTIDNLAYTAQDVQVALEVLRGKSERYILTSSCGIYRFVRNRRMPLREEDVDFDWNPPGFDLSHESWRYQGGKREAERVVRGQSDIPFTIIRPPIVFGPNDPTLRGYFYVQRLLDGQPLIVTNGGLSSFRLAYSRDLASAYVLAVANMTAIGKTYTVAQPDVMTLHDFLTVAAEALEIKPNFVSIPREVIDAAELDYADPYGSMVNFIPGVRHVQLDLGFTGIPFQEWVSDTVRWYRDYYQGDDSVGYDRRKHEIALVKWYQEKVVASTPK